MQSLLSSRRPASSAVPVRVWLSVPHRHSALRQAVFRQSLRSCFPASFLVSTPSSASFLHVFVTHYCYVTVAVVGQNVVDYRGDLFFQFVDKLSGVIFLVFNVAQFLLPYTREFAALEQFFLDGVNEFYARRSGNYVFLSRLM